MPSTRCPMTSEEIDDGWTLNDVPQDTPKAIVIVEPKEPYGVSDAFSAAYAEQIEGRTSAVIIPDAPTTFNLPPAPRPARRRAKPRRLTA